MTDQSTDDMARYEDDFDEGGESTDAQAQAGDIRVGTERELALRLVLSRALVDSRFYDQLRADPDGAVDSLHIRLADDDMRRIRELDWDRIDGPAETLRQELGFSALRGAW